MTQRIVGESMGTALLLYVIVGSGIAADRLSEDGAVQLLAHALAVGLGLAVLIAMGQTVSGSHFNPSVTLGFWRTNAMRSGEAITYLAAQMMGAIVGVGAANVSFGEPLMAISSRLRSGWGLVIAEFVATFVLVLLILALVRTHRSHLVPAAVGAWVATIIFATSSTGFANPAVTISRVLTDTYTGIDPASVGGFLAAQLLAGIVAARAATALYPAHEFTEQTRLKEQMMPITLSEEDQIHIRQAAERLQRRFGDELDTETVELLMNDSLEMLLERATTATRIPLLAERFTRDRLRALVRLDSDSKGLRPSVLFLCVHNAGRSQMAAGFLRHLAGDGADVFSGGSEPSERVNEAAVAVMEEKGIDISVELPQPWADEIVRAADVVVTMGCGDACPVFPGKRYVDWELDDPAGKPPEEIRPIRDEIECRVRALMDELQIPPRR